MCGRFVAAASPEELARYFGARVDGEPLPPSYNVAPTTEVYSVRAVADGDDEPHRVLAPQRWGLVPFWAKDPRIGSKMINARSETAATNGAFRRSMASRRCLIPATAFYEWQRIAGSATKQPYAISRSDDEILVFAGLWDRWHHDDDTIESCTILTTAPNSEMAAIHNRMPVMVPPHAFDRWIDPETGSDDVADLLVPAPDGLLRLTPVSTRVNRAANNGPDLLDPVDTSPEPTEQLALLPEPEDS